MANSSAALPAAGAAEAPNGAAVEHKGQRWFELCLVLAVSLGSSLYNALHILRYGMTSDMQRSAGKWVMGTAHEVAMLALLAYVLARTDRSLRDLGLRWSFRDVGVGAILCIVAYAAYFTGGILIGMILWISGIHPVHHGTKELFGGFSIFALLFSVVNPFYEELIVRAYLMTEITALTGSAALAAIASTLFQASYHLYYGWWAALSLGSQFLALSIYYSRWRRALPLIVAHGVFDLVGVFHLSR